MIKRNKKSPLRAEMEAVLKGAGISEEKRGEEGIFSGPDFGGESSGQAAGDAG